MPHTFQRETQAHSMVDNIGNAIVLNYSSDDRSISSDDSAWSSDHEEIKQNLCIVEEPCISTVANDVDIQGYSVNQSSSHAHQDTNELYSCVEHRCMERFILPACKK